MSISGSIWIKTRCKKGLVDTGPNERAPRTGIHLVKLNFAGAYKPTRVLYIDFVGSSLSHRLRAMGTLLQHGALT